VWAAALFLAAWAAAAPGAEPPLRVTIRAGPKTHGEGEHDHPRFLAEWSALLAERGAEVRGGLEFPSDADLAVTDVLVIYAAEGGSIHGEERARLERYLARGGGIAVLHDGVCGDDPQWFKTVVGGAWEHGHSRWQEGEIGLCFTGLDHPITRGAANFDFEDEIYWDLHLDPRAHVLANAFHTPFDVTPQMWVFEPGAYRAFVSIQGHNFASFAQPAWRTLLLRGIAWAGGRDADLLVTPEEAAGLRYPPGGPLAPEKAAQPMVLEPGFDVSLVAAEPLVVKPISLDWDARGRMWVACTPGYPDKEEWSGVPARDSVAILRDDDGDGRMDASTVFCGGLDLVTSLVLHRDGVIVTAAPHILWLRDLDGDDRADRVEVLYTGFGYADTHAVMSNLRFGPDGWVYGVQGYSGGDSKAVTGFATEPRPGGSPGTSPGGWGLGMGGAGGARGSPFGRIPNGLFRFRPDGSAIEPVASYGSNTWGLDFSPAGELFFSMANGSHLRHLVLPDSLPRGGRFGKAPSWVDAADHDRAFPLSHTERSPYQQIDFVGGFTAAAGCLVQDGGAWPAEYAGDCFVCEPTLNLVHRDELARRGPTFRASKPREAEFLASTDLWFRPVHLRTGPDGAMYVLDFYNQAAVHNDTRGPPHGPGNAALRPDRDHAHGRIWRVQHRDARAVEGPPPASLAPDTLLRELGSPNGWRRDTALRLLREGAAPERGRVLAFSQTAAEPRARLGALWLLDALGAPDGEVAPALLDPDPAVRWNAARILGRRPGGGGPPPEGLLLLLLDDDPRAVLEALLALARYDVGPDFAPAFAELAASLSDDWSRSALLGVFARAPAALLAACLAFEDPAALAPLALEAAARTARAGDVAGLAEGVRLLARPPAAFDAELVEGALQAFARELPPEVDLGPAAPRLLPFLSDGRLAIALAALPLAARLPGADAAAAAERLAGRLTALTQDPDAELALRLRALDALLAIPARRADGVAAAERFLDPFFDLETQLRVIDALGAAADDPAVEARAAELLVAAYPSLSNPARERAFHHLVQRPARLAPLFAALEDGRLRAADLGPLRRHRLESHPDAATAARARALLAAPAGGPKDALIASLLPQVSASGDAAAGAQVFRENCATCHAFGGEGGRVGPELKGVGAHGARALLTILLDPSREIDPSYVEYAAETVDGRILTGVLARETPTEIALRSSAGEEVVRRDQLASLASLGRSPMPEGFESLGATALRDLIAFLSAGYEDFRVIDLSLSGTTSTDALYDARRDARPMRFRATGVVDVGGVPFEILDPERVPKNAIALKGGMVADWDSKLKLPQSVTIPVGFALERLHVLGGIAAWGYPYTQSRSPILRFTWVYEDGEREELVLQDGDRFADWISRCEVPGSEWVDLLQEDSPGQVRRFTLDPARRGVPVRAIELASFDNHLSPTFLALTAQLRGADASAPIPAPWTPPAEARHAVFGGGTSHDFARWFREQDLRTLADAPEGAGGERYCYEELPDRLARLLPQLEVLTLCNNQPLPDPALRAGLLRFAADGGGLLLMHAATWYNWPDWPEYNRELVGGGTRGHEDYGEFVVTVVDAEHPLMQGVRSSFGIKDELYRFEPDPAGAPRHVLATGTSVATGATYPVAWTVERAGGRVLCLTLGHDGGAHQNPEFQTILRNAAEWLRPR
jgi:putative membrane-bound dehydrogenase-like protein